MTLTQGTCSGSDTIFGQEVTHMISNVLLNQSQQAAFGMPTSRCIDAAWLRALPMTTGEVSVHTDAKRDRIVVTTDGYAFPGTRAWSPPN